MNQRKFCFAIDRGGTFTDVWARCPDGRVRVMKLLSEDPDNYSDAPREGIRRILEQETGGKIPASTAVPTSEIEWIRMGTTVATNALLERKGERMALAITDGYKDLLHIGNQARPKIFDLEVVTPEVLYDEVIEVEGRFVLQQEKCQLNLGGKTVTGTTGEKLQERHGLNEAKLRTDLQSLLDKGIRSLAVVLMHSYTYSGHEESVSRIAKEMGFTHVSLSSHTMPMVRIVPRGFTACADAYLTPCIKRYVSSFSAGFGDLKDVRVLFMQSDGGLTPVKDFIGSRAIVSGPAGGVVGYAMTTYHRETELPVIGFDMGGTSTDVSRFAGDYEHVFESSTAGITIQAPQLDINTVAAGGGSQLFFRSGMFVVGPESAGAHPGPVCYKKGGPLAVTDANLMLGRILPEYFPKIFGKTEDQPLDKAATRTAFNKLTTDINDFTALQPDSADRPKMKVEEVAMGFIRVANEAMCRPIRALTQAKGYDTSRHVLACFGGAGGQHACAIARSLGMGTVFIHRYAGILSAYGMALADVVYEAQEPCAASYTPESFAVLDARLKQLTEKCQQELQNQGFDMSRIETEAFLHLRYDRTDCALMCSAKGYPAVTGSCETGDFRQSFLDRYKREFGFTIAERKIIVDDVRVRGVGKTEVDLDRLIPEATGPAEVEATTRVYFEDGYHDTRLFLLERLLAGHDISGPAIIIDKNSTILVEPHCEATITRNGDVKIKIGSGSIQRVGPELDAIQLSIFSHRFMSTAEQMGRILQRTSISTNIKERLDFSCAMFGPDGGLVANAPHIPVHLGAMQETVQYQMRQVGDKLRDGDVILSNHPTAGGSHLPDLTAITPVFYPGQLRPVFYVASRGHHADIGGITPGSMPPHSKSIFEEGAVFRSFFLVKNGVFQEEAVTEALNDPAKYPGSSGTRNLHDNLSDLRAQVAANQKGITLIRELIDEYGLDVVQAYMAYIQDNAEVAVRDMLREIAHRTKARTGSTKLSAVDYMDDGSPIALDVEIDEEKGSAVFDFSGTGTEVYGNCNAPRAVTLSAIIYCLRCMVGHDVPLNQGCLVPVEIRIPKGCMLNPSDTAAVVGGNVLTSQRVADVILKTFAVCAASQGCMNNITFGDAEVGYYETVAGGAGAATLVQQVHARIATPDSQGIKQLNIGQNPGGCMNVISWGKEATPDAEGWGYCETVSGGAGAGPTWHGRSGVHVHMTNTRITDPEILERRYPVILQKFSLNPGTGGRGQYCGGDGVIREILYRRPLTLSVLTERRVFHPYGMNGGGEGSVGHNLLIHPDGRTINLGAKTSIDMKAGDVFRLLTPGGGGYGSPDGDGVDPPNKRRRVEAATAQRYAERGSVHEYTMAQESA